MAILEQLSTVGVCGILPKSFFRVSFVSYIITELGNKTLGCLVALDISHSAKCQESFPDQQVVG